MKILGVDSSGLAASAAVLSGDTVVAEFTVNNKKTHSQTLLPMIKEVVDFRGSLLRSLMRSLWQQVRVPLRDFVSAHPR